MHIQYGLNIFHLYFWEGCDFVKLERISDNQIRCTLDSSDFRMRQMTLKELTYRSPKAKELFRDLLKRASEELDFEAKDMPLMIEAIPTSEESVTLLVTRVEDPEELDARFARFAPSNLTDLNSDDFDEDISLTDDFFERADEILELVRKFTEKLPSDNESEAISLTDEPIPDQKTISELCRAYYFSSLDDICEAAKIIAPFYDGENSVYKDPNKGFYILVVYKSHHTPTEFNTICNQLSEYSDVFRGGNAAIGYCEEHFPVISKGKALQVLRNL